MYTQLQRDIIARYAKKHGIAAARRYFGASIVSIRTWVRALDDVAAPAPRRPGRPAVRVSAAEKTARKARARGRARAPMAQAAPSGPVTITLDPPSLRAIAAMTTAIRRLCDVVTPRDAGEASVAEEQETPSEIQIPAARLDD
jgi:hypothetical protein